MLQSMGSQRVSHNLATENQQCGPAPWVLLGTLPAACSGHGFKCECILLTESTWGQILHWRRYRLVFQKGILREVLLYPTGLVETVKLQGCQPSFPQVAFPCVNKSDDNLVQRSFRDSASLSVQ